MVLCSCGGAFAFLSTLSLRRATYSAPPYNLMIHHFYPRSPCGERPRERASIKPIFRISIHALLAESDLSGISSRTAETAISIHALLAESDEFRKLLYPGSTRISIHALLAESDHSRRNRKQRHSNFYPRSPCGERHYYDKVSPPAKKFLSTLSLRRATCRAEISESLYTHFYPRSPCGERHLATW